jgi:tetratricopeptide (TPR) repeat protein
MPHSFCSRLLPVILCLALFTAAEARAQLDEPTPIQEVDPDQVPPDEEDDSVYEDEEPAPKRPGKKKPGRGREEEEPEPEPEVTAPTTPKTPPTTPASPASPLSPPPPGTASATPTPTPEAKPAAATPPPPLLAPRVSDADLLSIWERWTEVRRKGDAAAAGQVHKDLLKLRDEISASDLDIFSVSLLREARERRDAKDLRGAVQLAEAAATLSPNLPYARFALADAYARNDWTSVGKYAGEFQAGIGALVKDPRFRRPALANVGAMALLSLLATAVAVVAVLFARRVRYYLHDLHHMFGRGHLGRVQAVAVAVAVIAAPLLLQLGVVPVLLVLFGSIALYLSVTERVVVGVLLALTGLIPLAGGQIASVTAFAGTVAEDVYLLERGGFSGDEAATRVLARQAEKQATFAELFALGRYQARRGQLAEAATAYKGAASLKQRNALLLTNYANVLLASGDTEAATRLYQEAAQADSTLAAAPYNLALLYRREARSLPDDKVGAELQRASETMAVAQRLDSTLVGRDVPPDDRLLANLLLLSPALPTHEMIALADGAMAGRRVESQLDRTLMGMSGLGARLYPALLALLFALWGQARDRVRGSKSCDKCGRPVCRRCDPDLGIGAFMCSQCTNVFARKNVVPEPLRVKKQAEVQRHQTWMGRLTLALGALMSGAGHLFAGLPIRGAVYIFFFLLALSAVVLRDGLLRSPYGEAPLYLKLAPVALVILPLYLLSLRGLRKRQTE